MGNDCCASRKIPVKSFIPLGQSEISPSNEVENDNSYQSYSEPSYCSKSLGFKLVLPKRKTIPDLNIGESSLYLKRKGQVILVNNVNNIY